MRTVKFPLGLLIVALIVGVGVSAFWAGQASGGGSSLEVRTYQLGWASIAWLDDTMPVDAAVSSMGDSVGAVYHLDFDGGGWQRYIPGRADVSNLEVMAFGESYFLLFTEPMEMELSTEPEDVCPPDECPPCPTLGAGCPALEATTHIRQEHGTISPRETGEVTSSCDDGEVLTGGGYSVGSIGFSDKVYLNAPIDEETWAVQVFNNTDLPLDVWVWAICLEFGD